MASPIQKVGSAIARTGKGLLLDRVDPGVNVEGEWVKGLPERGTGKVDNVTGEVVERLNPTREIPPAVEDQALAEYAKGASQAAIEEKYEMAKGYIARCLTRRFGSPDKYRQGLKGLLQELAIACGEHTLAHVEQLHPAQSGALVGTMTAAIIALEKHEREMPKQIDFGELSRFGETLDRLEAFCGMKEVTGVEVTVEHLDSDAVQEVQEALAHPEKLPSD